MTTKVRATCDRCHDAKTRCSRDTPCRGCVDSGSMCIYSVSGVLGRPRGTKNKSYRRRTCTQASVQDGGRTMKSTSSLSRDLSRTGARTPQSCNTPKDRDEAELLDAMTTSDRVGRVGRLRQTAINGVSPADDSFQMLVDTSPYVDPSQLAEMTIANMQDIASTAVGVDAISQADLHWEGGMYSFDIPSLDTDSYHMLPSPSTEVHIVHSEDVVPITCTCVQQLAELLGSPNIAQINSSSESDTTVLSIGKVLALAKRGIKAWYNFIACPSCPYNNEGEVKVLVLLSIRPITRYLQRLAPQYAHDSCETPENGAPSHVDMVSTKGCSPIEFGGVELDVDECIAIYRLLFLKTVQRLRHVLDSLEAMERKRREALTRATSIDAARSIDFEASDGRSMCQQIIQTLANAVKNLETTLGDTR